MVSATGVSIIMSAIQLAPCFGWRMQTSPNSFETLGRKLLNLASVSLGLLIFSCANFVTICLGIQMEYQYW
jgi:hypothetical protein